MTSVPLHALGWSEAYAQAAREAIAAASPEVRPSLEPGRVASTGRTSMQVWTAGGPEEASLPGSLRHAAAGGRMLPVIGDWVIVQRPAEPPLRIVEVLPRRTSFARAVQGGLTEQVIAANVDVVFIVTTPDLDFDLPRLGRYVAAVQLSGARPVVLLNKVDAVRDVSPFAEAVAGLSPDLPVHAVSAAVGQGLDALRPYFGEGVTVALIGSSGVGKSTLTNRLLGREAATTGAVRDLDGQGRHTTTTRTLYRLPGGGLLIDNPGLRDIAVWDAGAGGSRFGVIEELATRCRYRGCTHRTEPGCAVRRAVERGEIGADLVVAYAEAQGLSPRKSRRR
ncbi:small ribosomal subunit biogenesis GTPase RsgA [Deinococcus carri]|uniref:Small ribosomal subunit biogenesis GTPase RsgA n=1 Tax=Deinococcus carri TaxID=1211323 RepID=A0ABP9W9X5_9DEIO